jgi:diguanylate cyclase (GGDEF)-like protein
MPRPTQISSESMAKIGRFEMTQILIVDDDPQDRQLIVRRLAKASADLKIVEAGSKSEAQKIARDLDIDIVLLDLTLVESDGLQTLQRFMEEMIDVPVIVLTGSTDQELEMKVIESGAQDFIRKSDIANPWLYRCLENAITRFELQQALKLQSLRDSLTQLPNRASFEESLQSAFQRYDGTKESYFAVVFIDLDDFKLINDCYGHARGDQVLLEFAQRAKNCSRSTDIVARFGGDEFVVLLESIKSENDIKKFVNRLYLELKAPLSFDGDNIFLSASVGYVASCDRYAEYQHMLRDADTAMYEAKKSGKQTHRRFAQEMRDEVVKKVSQESRTQIEIATNKYGVDCQPFVDSRMHEILKFEVLVHCMQSESKNSSPSILVPHKEPTDSIVPLGKFVFDSVGNHALN